MPQQDNADLVMKTLTEDALQNVVRTKYLLTVNALKNADLIKLATQADSVFARAITNTNRMEHAIPVQQHHGNAQLAQPTPN